MLYANVRKTFQSAHTYVSKLFRGPFHKWFFHQDSNSEKIGSVSLSYKISHMLWQHSCHAMCKLSPWTLVYNLDERKIKFSSNLNYNGIIIREMGPRTTRSLGWFCLLTRSSCLHMASYYDKADMQTIFSRNCDQLIFTARIAILQIWSSP